MYPVEILCSVSRVLNTAGRANNNLLLTEREGRTGVYWPEVVAVRTERSEVRTKRPGERFIKQNVSKQGS